MAGRYAIFGVPTSCSTDAGILCENCLGLGTLYTYNSTGNESTVMRVIDVVLGGARLFSVCNGQMYPFDMVVIQVR